MERRLWILALFAVVPVLAQETLTIDEAIQRAVRSHPLLSAQSQRVAAARGLVQQAGLRPNPRVYFQSENWSLSGADPVSTSANADQFAYFTQPIELGGKRQRRIELSQVNLRITSLEEELAARQIASRVSLAYWAAVGAQRVRSLWVEQLDNFRQTTEYHEVRVREGALAESELLRVRLEADRFSVAAASAALDAERARIALFQAMGEAGGRPIVLSTPLDSNIQLPPVDMDRALRERTELRRPAKISSGLVPIYAFKTPWRSRTSKPAWDTSGTSALTRCSQPCSSTCLCSTRTKGISGPRRATNGRHAQT